MAGALWLQALQACPDPKVLRGRRRTSVRDLNAIGQSLALGRRTRCLCLHRLCGRGIWMGPACPGSTTR